MLWAHYKVQHCLSNTMSVLGRFWAALHYTSRPGVCIFWVVCECHISKLISLINILFHIFVINHGAVVHGKTTLCSLLVAARGQGFYLNLPLFNTWGCMCVFASLIANAYDRFFFLPDNGHIRRPFSHVVSYKHAIKGILHCMPCLGNQNRC